ncbi:hypothetical protein B0H10DRAFT_2183679 [Mycena sp. CBHHK59/15]|nr:hypothetical protein B0H10DRAFT_2183679 [Mycena sp. CBHHK59/15]
MAWEASQVDDAAAVYVIDLRHARSDHAPCPGLPACAELQRELALVFSEGPTMSSSATDRIGLVDDLWLEVLSHLDKADIGNIRLAFRQAAYNLSHLRLCQSISFKDHLASTLDQRSVYSAAPMADTRLSALSLFTRLTILHLSSLDLSDAGLQQLSSLELLTVSRCAWIEPNCYTVTPTFRVQVGKLHLNEGADVRNLNAPPAGSRWFKADFFLRPLIRMSSTPFVLERLRTLELVVQVTVLEYVLPLLAYCPNLESVTLAAVLSPGAIYSPPRVLELRGMVANIAVPRLTYFSGPHPLLPKLSSGGRLRTFLDSWRNKFLGDSGNILVSLTDANANLHTLERIHLSSEPLTAAQLRVIALRLPSVRLLSLRILDDYMLPQKVLAPLSHPDNLPSGIESLEVSWDSWELDRANFHADAPLVAARELFVTKHPTLRRVYFHGFQDEFTHFWMRGDAGLDVTPRTKAVSDAHLERLLMSADWTWKAN